jgi:rod shape determining protein RodA
MFAIRSNYRLLRNYAIILYALGLLSLIGVLLFGVTIRGTTGWFALGPVNMQPVEFMKIAHAVLLAAYFSERARRNFGWKELLESGALTAIPVGLTLMQPDAGSASLLIGMWGVVVLFAGLKPRHAAVLIGSGLAFAWVAWNYLLAKYQIDRIMTFLDPSLDPLGSGYNVTQAIIAIGAGGLFGRGLGFGSQSQLKFLPESQTDFIFAVIAEELGFLGVALLLTAFILLFFRLGRIARHAGDDFTAYLVVAIAGVLFVQMMVNIGMNVGLLPVTGVTLPLVSYGGSSLVFTLLMLGIVESAASLRRRGFDRREGA